MLLPVLAKDNSAALGPAVRTSAREWGHFPSITTPQHRLSPKSNIDCQCALPAASLLSPFVGVEGAGAGDSSGADRSPLSPEVTLALAFLPFSGVAASVGS